MANAAPALNFDIHSTLAQPCGDPQIDAMFNKGMNLMKLKKYGRAAEIFRDIMKEKPDHFASVEQLGIVARELGDFERALLFFKALTEHVPTYLQAYGHAAIVLMNMERYEEAVDYFRKALSLGEPAFAHAGLGVAYTFLAKDDLAAEHTKKAMELSYDHAEFLYNHLIFHHKFKDSNDPHINHVLQLLRSRGKKMSAKDQAMLYTILFKAYEDLKDYDNAMKYAAIAGKIRKEASRFNIQDDNKKTLPIIKYFDADFFKNTEKCGSDSKMPVFILAMPRSGTSLLEQILHSHPDVTGIGEDSHFGDLLREHSMLPPHNGVAYPFGRPVSNDKVLSFEDIAKNHLVYLETKAQGAKRVVDKAIANYYFAGLIHLAFPNACLIHLTRNPLSSAISSYTRNFVDNAHPYTNDLHDLGTVYRLHYDIMNHWKEVLPPGRIIDVSYEGIIEDTEGEARRIIDALGLPWNDACLEFYKTKKIVKTASVQQVRQPIYKSSLETWRKYEKHLAPLVEALGPYAPPESLYIIEKYGESKSAKA